MSAMIFALNQRATLITALLFTFCSPIFAADDIWTGGGTTNAFEAPANWSDGTPPGIGDTANFTDGAYNQVGWSNATGDFIENDFLTIDFSTAVEFVGNDGQHTYTISGDTLIDNTAGLELNNIVLNTAGNVVVGSQDYATTFIHGGGQLNASVLFIGEDVNSFGSYSSAIVTGLGSQINANNIILGRDFGVGFPTAELLVSDEAQVATDFLSLKDNAIVQVANLGTGLETGSVIVGLDAQLSVSDQAVLTAQHPQASIVAIGGAINITDDAQVTGFATLISGSNHLWSPGLLDGHSTITVDGANTYVALTGQGPGAYTGISLGFGNAADMWISGGAEVIIGESGIPGVASGFAVGQDMPSVFGGPTYGGTSTLNLDGAGSRLEIIGADISGAVGASGATEAFFDAIGVPGVDTPFGYGQLNITNGAEVVFSPTGGGYSRLYVADQYDSSGDVWVSGPGSLLATAGDFFLGTDAFGNAYGGGYANLNVDNAGVVQTNSLRIGQLANAWVSGIGSTLEVDSSATVSGGTLDISGGAELLFSSPSGGSVSV